MKDEIKEKGFSHLSVIEKAIPAVRDEKTLDKKKRKLPKINLFYNER